MQELRSKDLAVNIYRHGRWGSYVHRQLPPSTGNIIAERTDHWPTMGVDLESAWIETENAHVNVLNRGDLSSLTWLQSPPITKTDQSPFDTCTVHYASLNFRDIMLGKWGTTGRFDSSNVVRSVLATGKLNPEAIPGMLTLDLCASL